MYAKAGKPAVHVDHAGTRTPITVFWHKAPSRVDRGLVVTDEISIDVRTREVIPKQNDLFEIEGQGAYKVMLIDGGDVLETTVRAKKNSLPF